MSLDFDITLREERVTVGGKRYVLREANGEAAAKYKSARLRTIRMSDGKPTGMEGAGELEPLLVSLCLFEAYDHQGEAKERPVILATVRAWPAHVVRKLFELARDMSELEEKEDKAALEKQLAETQAKLAAMSNGENPAKKEHSCSTAG